METVKYLCEFFFGNFWHYVGLLLILALFTGTRVITINHRKEDDK